MNSQPLLKAKDEIMMKTIIIIQARMGSTRLPGKVLKQLGHSTVLDYVVTRCRAVKKASEVIVATSTLPQDDLLVEWCKQKGILFFRGSQDDVLSRYYECAKHYQPDYIIRVTSDCPFIDYELIDQFIGQMEISPVDNVLLEGELPRGLASEIFAFSAIEYMNQHGKELRHREHVTYYAYEHPKEFRSTVIQINPTLRHPEFRITLDTEEDYAMLKCIADSYPENKLVAAEDVVSFLVGHPEVAKINAHIQQKPVI
jgi:spore coat polysaccharide biosynthesis protein SpsF